MVAGTSFTADMHAQLGSAAVAGPIGAPETLAEAGWVQKGDGLATAGDTNGVPTATAPARYGAR
jgi:hypothetical protein